MDIFASILEALDLSGAALVLGSDSNTVEDSSGVSVKLVEK